MSDAELRKQGRFTWLLVAFSALVILFMAQQVRATVPSHTEKFGGTYAAGLLIKTGSNLK